MRLTPMPVPREVEVTPVGTVRLVWNDGHVSVYRAPALRAKCPCAACIDEWTHEVKIRPGDVPASLTARSASRVGNYALTFTWSDGHATGIYPYDRLRELCPCADCRE